MLDAKGSGYLSCAAERDTYGTLIDIQKVDILGESRSRPTADRWKKKSNPTLWP